jgi:eukaryotic-like serine/threonine-protein kinase
MADPPPRKIAPRPAWGVTRSAEETRAYLQERLTLFTKLMFTSFAILMAFLAGMYLAYPSYEPPDNELIFIGGAAALAVMAAIWRLLLVGRTLSITALNRVDTVYAVCIGVAFALSAVLAYPLRPAAYASLVYGCCTVFTRAIVVPSSGSRTLLTSIALFLPMLVAACYLAVTTTQELPGPAFAAGAILLSTVAIVLATMGSRVIYGLRRSVSEAMQLGQYTLGRKLGGGGMGEVYEARHALLRRPTAIKLLRPDRIGAEHLVRFEREVQHMSQLTHPNTVAVYDYGHSPDKVFYYAMEYLDGVDLAQLVHGYGPQPAGRVVRILIQVAGALQEAHDAELIHRDVKPGNIILCQRGGVPDVAKVVDYGLVKEITRDGTASTQILLGTPDYLAPELVTDPDRISPAVDLYALGAVAYFLLTGKRVFEGRTAIDVCMQHVTRPPRPMRELTDRAIPPELETIVMRCLAKDPAERFGSAVALAEALEQLPPTDDWDRRAAERWWRELEARRAATPRTDTPTLTMPIDLGART